MEDNSVDMRLRVKIAQIAENQPFRQTFRDLQDLMNEIAVTKGWHNPTKTFGEQVVMMHSELSEVIEAFREPNSNVAEVYTFEKTIHQMMVANYTVKPEGVPIEFADLVIRMLDTCSHYNIDLIDAIILKALYNTTRPHRHGDKAL